MLGVRPHATETQLPSREELEASYCKAIKRRDEAAAIAAAKQLGTTTADMRPPEQRVREDLGALKNYPLSLEEYKLKLADFASAVAWGEVIDGARKWANEIQRKRMQAANYVSTMSAELGRLEAFGVDVREDLRQAKIAYEKAIMTARERINRDYGLLICNDVVVPVKREVSDEKKR